MHRTAIFEAAILFSLQVFAEKDADAVGDWPFLQGAIQNLEQCRVALRATTPSVVVCKESDLGSI